MYVKRNCNTCGREFFAIKDTQHWCQRRCFKRAYYVRIKARNLELARRRPSYRCPLCQNLSEISFDPIKNEDAFDNLVCPYCGMPHRVILSHQFDMTFAYGNPGTARFIISSAIVSQTALLN